MTPDPDPLEVHVEPYELFFGEIHTHTALSDGNGSPEDNFDIAKSHLDFWAMADHAFDREVFDLDYRQRKPNGKLLNDEWAHIQALCRDHEAPGEFVPFLAYEWTNYQYGHHNVYYLDYDQPIRMPPTLPDLYDALRAVDAFVIPHHGGYPVGICGKNWDCHDDELSPFVEIYSLHGSSEEPQGIRPLLTSGSWMGPGASGGSVQEGLERGHRLGIMASSDSHGDHPGAYDNGLIAAYADELTRESLWDAFKQRRVYGVTGDRIKLDFSIDGQCMGSRVRSPGPRAIDVSVVAWDQVDRVDIIKNGKPLHTFVEPVGRVADSSHKLRVRFMVEWGWDSRGEREWDGSLTIVDGNIAEAVPCFRGNVARRVGRGIASLSASECRWKSRTEQVKIPMVFRRFADAVAFEVECGEQAQLRLSFVCDGLEQQRVLSPADLTSRSAVVYLEDVPATNNGSHWRSMDSVAKVKVHQGWPADELTLNLRYEDDAVEAPAGRADCYYVRVIQRNGQRAWSSPIWVEAV